MLLFSFRILIKETLLEQKNRVLREDTPFRNELYIPVLIIFVDVVNIQVVFLPFNNIEFPVYWNAISDNLGYNC